MKFIVVTGGVISGLGKGITASSIGLLLQSLGLTVTSIKIDPYINVDAGTMSPFEHGECYVLKDGGEADLDMGNYERFLNIELTKDHNITTGKIYQSVINKERNGDFLGKTVQIIPHITDEIQGWIRHVAHIPVSSGNTVPDVCIVEVGGTVGDIEIAPFIEALRQMHINSKTDKFFFVHVSMVLNNQEMKTKPTQQSVAKLRSLGIIPNMLVIRAPTILPKLIKNKLSIFCQVKEKNIISNTDVKSIYFVPDVFKKQGICERILKKLRISVPINYQLNNYYKTLNHYNTDLPKLNLGIVAKYIGSPDTYLSLIRAVEHASFINGVHVNVHWLNSEENIDRTVLQKMDGFIIPGGFGTRGVSGKLDIAKYARENCVPILGICLGMQIMVVDCWRALGKKGGSTEWDDFNGTAVIDILPGQTGIKGGTMRLGNYSTYLKDGSLVNTLYKTDTVEERHRHRYEVNNECVSDLEDFGLEFVGRSRVKSGELMEVVELNDHKFYVGSQYHPEYKTSYDKAHPLFIGLVKAMIK